MNEATNTTPEMLEAPETVVEEKPYKFRRLGSKDVFLMFKIISRIGINEFTACFGNENVLKVIKKMSSKEKASEEGAMIATASVLLEVVNVILGNIDKCENEIYQMLSNTSNLSIEEITAEGNAVMFMEMLFDFLKKDEFPDFIQVVLRSFR